MPKLHFGSKSVMEYRPKSRPGRSTDIGPDTHISKKGWSHAVPTHTSIQGTEIFHLPHLRWRVKIVPELAMALCPTPHFWVQQAFYFGKYPRATFILQGTQALFVRSIVFLHLPTGVADKTILIHCRWFLLELLETDIHWFEDAAWFPFCVYIRYIKGTTCISECGRERFATVGGRTTHAHSCNLV